MRYLFTVLTLFLLLTPAMAENAAQESDTPFKGVYLSAKAAASLQLVNSPGLTVDGVGSFSFSEKSDTTFGGGVAIGYDFAPRHDVPLRAEIEYMMRAQDEPKWTGSQGLLVPGPIDWELKAETTTDTLLANVYYDFMKGAALSPFISAGVGIAFTETRVSYQDNIGTPPLSIKDDTTDLAWTIGLGCNYSINDNWSLDLGYRFLDVGKAEVKEDALKVSADTYFHETTLGIRYTF